MDLFPSAAAQTATTQTPPPGTPMPAANASGWANMDPWMIVLLAVLAAVVAFLFWRRYSRRGDL